jgi:thiol reductant ABC exporter CydC subunit
MSATSLRRLLQLADAPRGRVAVCVLFGALTVLFGAGLMATAGYLISRAAERPPILELTVAIVAVRFFGLARPIARYIERLASHDLAFRVLASVRVRVYRRIEPLAPTELAAYRRGDLLARMVADVDALQNLHLRGILPPLVAAVAGAVSVAVTALFLPVAAAILAVGLLIGGVAVPALTAALAARAGRRRAPLRGDLSADLVDLFHGAPELVAYGREQDLLHRVRAHDARLVRQGRRAAFGDGLGNGLGLAVTGATVAAVLAVAADAHAAGSLDRVSIAMLGLLALASFDAVTPLARSARELSETLASGRRVLDLTDRTARVADPPRPVPLPPAPFVVALEDVSVCYAPGEAPALDGVSLRLEPGSRVALMGPSGCGKTTVANLLLRFLDPERGRVTLAGRDLREYRQEDVRRAVAIAGQDAHLFSTSIRHNVLLGRPDASDEELEDALGQARIWDWVHSLPEGWDTMVGENGRELSGGQAQRICVARALLTTAPVLVLDEPTAHLDAATAATLIEDVLAAAGDRAVLLMTHRPEGLEVVDEVLVLG